jgi:hypothetical protein
MGSGCVPHVAATQPDEPYFDHLQAGEISEFDQRIKADVQTGTDRDPTRIGVAWIDFLTCEQIAAAPPESPQYRWAFELLTLEEARRATFVVARQTAPRQMTDLFYGALDSDQSLRWEPGENIDADIVWPAEDEDWADEFTAAAPVERHCDELPERVLQPLSAQRNDGATSFDALRGWYRKQFESIARANEAAAAAGRALAGPARELDLQVNIYAVGLAAQLARFAAERDDTGFESLASFGEATRGDLEAAVGRAEADGVSEGETLAAAHFVLGHLAMEAGETEPARRHVAAARRAGPASSLEWPVRHVDLGIAWSANDWDAIAGFSDELPPATFPNFGSYTYWKAVGVLRAGHSDRFLAIVTDAMADRAWANDRYLEATWAEVLRYLTGVAFDERVVELVENLGPRTETFARMEELGRTALDLGRPNVADDVASWLLGRDADARRHARYFAIRALADFLRDDQEGFRSELRRVTRRDPKLLEAIPRSRQARFFEHADRELARILAQTMPMMAEWGDEPAAKASRREWLELLVDEIQLFLRTAEETSARSQLVELYRLAGELLADHPRGYAERVGRQNGDPVLLGTVRVQAPEFENKLDFTPARYDFPRFFAPVPRDSPVSGWNHRWDAFDREESE